MNTLLNKRGFNGVNAKIAILIGALIFVVILVALTPQMFVGLTNFTASGAPAWMDTIMPVVVSAGLLFMVWRLFV